MCIRRLILAWAVLACGSIATAQSPYGSVTPASPAWGSQIVNAPAPYQPVAPIQAAPYQPVVPNQPVPAYTMPGPVPLSPAPPADPTTGQVWQAYPAPDTPSPVGVPPGGLVPPPSFSTQAPIYPATPAAGAGKSLLPAGTRSGVFQKANFLATWMPQLDSDSLGWTDLRTDVVFGLPFFTRETPIVITPAYEVHVLDRPDGFDLPPRLHDLSIDFHHFRRIGENWIADFAITPGLYADDHSFDSSDAFRVNGRALAIYESSPAWKWILGVTYIDGGWAKVVPIAGVNYEPNDDVEYQLVFPNPKISWRLPNSPDPGRDEYWAYVEADFGNSIWAFEQSDGTPDVLASRDYRLILGLQHKIVGGLSSRAEIGYVFNREIKLASTGETDLDDTFLLRVGLTY